MSKTVHFILISCILLKAVPVLASEKCYLKGTEEIDHSFAGEKKIILYCKYECPDSNTLKMKIKEKDKECEEVIDGGIDDALESCDKAIEIGSNSNRANIYRVYNNRATVLNKLDRHKEALGAAEIALNIMPDYEMAINAKKYAVHQLNKD
jgi:tetratricopeptide (TPR) repeat protein